MVARGLTTGAYPLPITGGSIPADWQWGWWQEGKNPLRSGGTSIVHACIDAYAQTMASMPVYHWRYRDDDTKKKIMSSAMSRTLMRPNSYQTRSDFYLNVVKGLLIDGNSYIYGVRNERNEVVEIHQLPKGSTLHYIDSETKTLFYAAGNNPMLEDLDYMIPARDICHIRLYCPRHPLVGVSPIENAVE